MNTVEFGKNRWTVRYGYRDGAEKTAVDRVCGLIQPYVPYILTASPADCAETLPEEVTNRVVIGTMRDNAELRQLAEAGFFVPEERAEGYCIKTGPDPAGGERHVTVLQGADAAGVLYAAADYERYAIRDRETYHGYHYNGRYRPFVDEPLPFERRSAPRIEHRGLWSWGHVIYDYKAYIDRMSECKLNTLILWNDYAPLNAAEIIRYAHDRAVKVIWGFSWCWGEKVDPEDPADLKKWTDFVLRTYETQYRPLGADGIYFQAFTETRDTTIGGRSISELVIEWVGSISREVYARYPELWIQFGLHATSIREECGKFAAIDPRMSIVWEDAGDFPYAYDPAKNEREEETLAYTKELLALRGTQERFGAVLKGFTVLNWTRFEHQKGPFVLGEASPVYTAQRAEEKEFYWRYAAPYWIRQAPFLRRFLQTVADAPVHDRLITALVEDGVWEGGLHVSVQLLSELLWDPDADPGELLTVILHDARTRI
ncbi:MAG: hypothetical protein SOX31_07265 [Eubacteriales bacterium]|nr:hypothetical protein [Eubacteriales bacterium]